MKLIDSGFAILDVMRGRKTLAKRLNDGPKIPVIVYGELEEVHSRDDGISLEFSINVRQAIEGFDFEAAEMVYDREQSLALRESVTQLRDSALKGGHMEWAVHLSHVVAWMHVLIEERWPKVSEQVSRTPPGK